MNHTAAAAILLLSVVAMSAGADELGNDREEPTKILVTFSDPGMSKAARAGPAGPGYRRRLSHYVASIDVKLTANRIARDFGLTTLDEWPIFPLKVHCLVFGVDANTPVDEILDRLRRRPEVESAQLLNEFDLSGSIARADPYLSLQHNIDTLELIEAHNWSTGDGTRITIIDTGADLGHPELRSQIADHQDFVRDRGSDFSADAHGTAVAGVIGAAANNGVGVVGVAPSTRLSVLRACWYRQGNSRAVCDSFTLAKALTYTLESETDIINLSLGGPSDALLGRLLRIAIERGTVVIAAAPNDASPGFPADVPGVIVVGSRGPAGTQELTQVTAITAPGDDILVPVPFGGYDYASGSSLSAAHVSGIVALLIARQPELSSTQIESLLLASRPGIHESVNACRAVTALLQISGCRNQEAVSHSY